MSHWLERLFTGALKPPPEFMATEDGIMVPNEDYEGFIAQDSALASWLLSSINPHLLSQFVGSLKKDEDRMRVCLSLVKEICDALTSYGSVVPTVSIILINVETQLAGFAAQEDLMLTSAHVAQGPETVKTSSNLCWQHFDEDFHIVSTNVGRSQYARDTTNVNNVSYDKASCDCCLNETRRQLTTESSSQAYSTTSSAQDQWVVDFGATHHVTHNSGNITHRPEHGALGKLIVGNGVSLHVNMIGDGTLVTLFKSLLLNDLLHVPRIKQNLLSVSKFARDNSVYFEFYDQGFCVSDVARKEVLLHGRIEGGLYVFSRESLLGICGNSSTNSTVVVDDFTLWHQRLGHATYSTIVDVCKTIDDRSQAVSVFKLFQQMVLTKFGVTIKVVQSDWGGEYRSLSSVLAKDGISHRVAMSLQYWYYDVVTIIYLINRLPTKVLSGVSPLEKLWGKKPDYRFMRVFGCKCFPHFRVFQRHKLEFRSHPSHHTTSNDFASKYGAIEIVVDVNKLHDMNNGVCGLTIPIESCKKVTRGNVSDIAGGESLNIGECSSLYLGVDHNTIVNNYIVVENCEATMNTSDSLGQDDVESSEQNNVESNGQDHVELRMNLHPMLTRSKCGIFKLKVYSTAYATMKPVNVQEALQLPHWRNAIYAEL
ncbi:uncharacterized protein LOC120152790 [Hibiscus syriacus]|uniref:uncharacterized protein LOC120152790 n=1 Tax=Hibiscus syriacus TaxID=106335 RepID=UPI0019207D47|nr:uncharacterized protein LOC120152790 [Hibiscus syriacus]